MIPRESLSSRKCLLSWSLAVGIASPALSATLLEWHHSLCSWDVYRRVSRPHVLASLFVASTQPFAKPLLISSSLSTHKKIP